MMENIINFLCRRTVEDDDFVHGNLHRWYGNSINEPPVARSVVIDPYGVGRGHGEPIPWQINDAELGGMNRRLAQRRNSGRLPSCSSICDDRLEQLNGKNRML